MAKTNLVPEKIIFFKDKDDDTYQVDFFTWEEKNGFNSPRTVEEMLEWAEKIEVENPFRAGFKFLKKNGAYFLETPEGYKISFDTTDAIIEILTKTTVLNGVIQEKCAITSSRSIITEQTYLENTNILTVKKLEVGKSYKVLNSKGEEKDKIIFLGPINLVDLLDKQIIFDNFAISLEEQIFYLTNKNSDSWIRQFSNTDRFVLIDDLDMELFKNTFDCSFVERFPVINESGQFCNVEVKFSDIYWNVEISDEKTSKYDRFKFLNGIVYVDDEEIIDVNSRKTLFTLNKKTVGNFKKVSSIRCLTNKLL